MASELLSQRFTSTCRSMSRSSAAGKGWSGRSICLDGADDGPGIPAEIRSRVFEPYVTTRKIGEGMGLGLAICKKILLDHDGDLEVLASSGAGTTFRLTFPRKREEAAA